MSKFRKTGSLLLTAVMALSAFSTVGTTKVQAADFSGQLESADSVTIDGNVATVSFNGGAITGKITFLEDGIFRYNVDPQRNSAITRQCAEVIRIPVRSLHSLIILTVTQNRRQQMRARTMRS